MDAINIKPLMIIGNRMPKNSGVSSIQNCLKIFLFHAQELF